MLSKPVLLYDGTCGFCRVWVNRLRRWDRRGQVAYVTYQTRRDIPDLPSITDAELDRAAHVVMPDGRIAAGARAAPLLLGVLPGGALLRPLFRIPGVAWVGDRVYSWVAEHRHQLGGGDSCSTN
jgi:predicted DCC family thiol-disulfide oxidoreductase YuxK